MRIDGFVPASGMTPNTGLDILSNLKSGDMVRAQVLENSGNELTLRLSDGSKVTANATTPVDAADGEYVNFVYKGTINGKPALEVANSNIQPQVDTAIENIKNTLASLNLPVTDQNIVLAQALKGQNQPVNIETMTKMIDLVNSNTDLKPDSAAFLTAANMSNDKNGIEKLQSLLAGRLNISNDIIDLLKLINTDNKSPTAALKSDMVNSILEKLAAQIPSKMTEQLNSSTAVNKAGVATYPSSVGTAANATVTTTTTTTTTTTNIANANGISTTNIPLNSSSITSGNVNTSNLSIDTTANKTVSNTANNSVVNNSSNNADAINKNNLSSSIIEGASNNTAGSSTASLANTKSNINPSYTAEHIRTLLSDGVPLGKADLPLLSSLNSQLEAMINRGDMSLQELSAAKLIAKEIGFAIFRIQSSEAASAPVSSSANSIKSFEDAVNNLRSLFVKIDQNNDEINPVKLYKNLDNAIAQLRSSIQQLPAAMQEAAINIASNLESNVNFINQLNSYSSYVQMPLSIFNHNTTGELYMLKKGSKAKKLDPSKMTILISLDSNNIGRIDTLLSVDKKNISTNFRLENSEIFKVLKENHMMLYTSLLNKGYRLVDFTYRLMEEPINIVNFEAEAKKEFIKSPNNIDVLI